MHDAVISSSNQWLAFTDDLLWSRNDHGVEHKMLRSLICQQLLVNETCIIPDSWWLSNRMLESVVNETDLKQAIKSGYLAVAIADKYSIRGLYGRYTDQISLPKDKQLAGFIA